VARDLLGCCLLHGERAGKIVEVEAYLGLEDRAAHASRGLTARTQVLFGPPGHAYVYLIYGMHECLNLVAEPDGTPGCVLIRALEPVYGLDGARTTGPGRLTKAMGITRRHNGVDVTRGELVVRQPELPEPVEILTTPRIGITHCADWPLRFCVEGSRFVSRRS
jgi:DNA-3-methyladenine glycosylase